jgi:hypothetical protein
LSKKIGSDAAKTTAMTAELDTARMTVEGTLLNCRNQAFNFKVSLFIVYSIHFILFTTRISYTVLYIFTTR